MASKRTPPRQATITRKTGETDITASVTLDGTGVVRSETGVGFLDHMIGQLARHGLMDIKLKARGDLHIDSHHTVEDCGWTLGAALSEALRDRRGICRYGMALTPMDEALTRAALDISGRPHLVWRVELPTARLGDMDTEVIREFFQALSQAAGITLHIENLYGDNTHHIIESCFKAVACALRQAMTLDPERADTVPSTKGVIG